MLKGKNIFSFPNPQIPANTPIEEYEIFVVYDSELRHVWINPSGAAQWGISLEAVRGKSNKELFGQKAAEIEELLQKVLQTGEKIEVDCKIPLLEGLKIYHSTYKPVKDKGRVIGVAAIYKEVKETRNWQTSKQKEKQRDRFRSEQYKALSEVVARIRKSLDLETIFKSTATEVRQLIAADRVAVFRFYPEREWEGEVVSEDVLPGWVSAMHTKVHDHCFGERYAIYYKQGRIAAIDNIYTAGLKDCYVEILAKFQVFANLVAPLRVSDRLWGLLCIHQCSNPRHWEKEEIEFIAQIAEHLGVAIQHAEYLQQVKEQSEQLKKAAEREKAISATIEKIRRTLDIDEIFSTTTQEVRQLLECDRVAVYKFFPDFSGAFVAESFAREWLPLVGSIPCICDTYLQTTQGGRYANNEILAVDDIYQTGYSECHLQLLEQFQAKAYVTVPIWQGEKLWGLLAAYQNSRSRHWEKDEINLLKQISVQMGVALQQAELLAQTRHQAEELATTLRNLQQTQAQLIQSEKMASLGQLVAGIAHEINNPVNFIHGNLTHVSNYVRDLIELVKIYQQEYTTTPIIKEKIEALDLEFLITDLPKTLSSMKVGTERIRQLVLSLRNFSRLDEAESKRANIHQGIDSTLLILQHRLQAKKEQQSIEVIKEYGQLPLVQCYPAQLNQVFMNLLSNAIDALEEGNTSQPTIWIRTQVQQGNRAIISIADNGPGIPTAIRDRIFDPFFTTKPVGKGTGLGLSISYQIIVEKHGGVIQCLSQPGEGTEFRIEIPIQPALEGKSG
ncbi:MAG TPA: GAF domain-containing protein [Oscillatoriaceae cyanobacterium M7585_C2015_266]|nr:GAF domain-containing protein [Oscillatoriaceae cyanobacterium M7585_C2015_266]